jgi:tetratricopeptide (TPR) repeat protein
MSFVDLNVFCQKKGYALIIGINDQESGLEYADNDAHHFESFLLNHGDITFEIENIKLVLDKNRIPNVLNKFITSFSQLASYQSTFYFYYAGHLFSDKNGVYFEIENRDWMSSKVEIIYLDTLINTICSEVKSKDKLFFIDACNSALLEPIFENIKNPPNSDKRNIAFLSSGDIEKSYEPDDLKHGVFTYYLIKGLEGEAENNDHIDGVITTSELLAYLLTQVPNHPKSQGQTPCFIQDPNIPFIVNKGVNGITSDVTWEKLQVNGLLRDAALFQISKDWRAAQCCYDNPLFDGTKILSVYTNKANCLIKRGIGPSLSEKLYEKALTLNPKDPYTLYNIGVLHQRNNTPQRAIKFYSDAIKSKKDFKQAYNNMGCCYYSMGLYDIAIDNFNSAISIDPLFDIAYNNLGLAKQHIATLPNSVEKDIKKAIDLNFENKVYQFNLGNIFFNNDEFELATSCYERAIFIDTAFLDAIINLAVVYYKQGNFMRSMEYFTIANNLAPNNSLIHFYIGLIHLVNKRYGDAKAEFESILFDDQTNGITIALYWLAVLNDLEGESQQALNFYTQYQLSKDSKYAKKALQRIKFLSSINK